MPEQLESREARQGRKGLPVLKVLVAALILAMIAWAGAELFGESSDPAQPARENATENDAGEQAPAGEPPTVPE